ncbi:MAG: DEAD/DEAH box helicase [Treponema sp.]|nr:DEAD/DEAH box helicase [Treponema sp.]
MIIDEAHPFSSFGLSDTMLQAIARKGWTAPSSIQGIALPRLLADEGHCIVKARTGTGKTAAFGIPLIERLTQAGHAPRALILAPTRELALQVSREIASLVTGHYPRITAVYGGASIRNQILDLRRGTEIVVGTPGRIMDLMERKALDLSAVDWFILDEADEMLDMGFFEDVEKILQAVKDGRRESGSSEDADAKGTGTRGTLHVALFSATMPDPILKVVRRHIGDVEIIVDAAPEDEKPLVDQYCVIVKREDKLEALRRIIDSAAEFYGLIFCATKVETDELARRLIEAGYPAEAIHGDLSQEVRERTLRRFRFRKTAAANSAAGGEPAILVATDVAARGLDIAFLSHVINWDLPNDRETYLHRIGRTARAGRRGVAISLATPGDRHRIHQFSRMMEKNLGSGILWLKVPSVKAVMKSLRRRITSAVVAALGEPEIIPEIIPDIIPDSITQRRRGAEEYERSASSESSSASQSEVLGEVLMPDTTPNLILNPEILETGAQHGNGSQSSASSAFSAPLREEKKENSAFSAPLRENFEENASPFLAKVCRGLIERLGAERAVEALVSLSYGNLFDPARYGPIKEFSEDDFKETAKAAGRGRDERRRGRAFSEGGRHATFDGGQHGSGGRRNRAGKAAYRESGGAQEYARVYVGQGRQHGAHPRDIATFLMRAAGVPGRLVDEIEMRDYCSFATLPADAARRACAFSGKDQQQPVIRFARPADHRK